LLDSDLRELISLSASSRTNAFGCQSAFAASILSLSFYIHGARSDCFCRAVITNATGTPFYHSSKIIIVNKGNCGERKRMVSTEVFSAIVPMENFPGILRSC
jgi:hypothetical protein